MTDTLDPDRELLLGFIEESMDSLAEAEQGLIRMEAEPYDTDHLNAVFRAVHSLKGNSAFFDLMRVKRLSHKMEDLLDALRQKKTACTPDLIDRLLPGLDLLRRMLERVRDGESECEDEALFDQILSRMDGVPPVTDPAACLDKLDRLLKRIRRFLPEEWAPALDDAIALTEAGAPEPKPPSPERSAAQALEPAAPEPAIRSQAGAPKTDKTMRISESSLDGFLDHVGELLGIEEMLHHAIRMKAAVGRQGDPVLDDLKQTVQQFSKLSAALRKDIMDIRKVSPQALLGKAPRIIREVAQISGKQITVLTSGEEIPIDKSYADLLDAPLIHMVRNAADHGIETPDRRIQAGKPAEGTIRVDLTEEELDLVLSVSDDGGGLDLDALGRKAAELGLVSPGAPLSDEDVIHLLFMSGVSTAGTVTEISGRGVGMDVVRQAIESAGGRITVDSRPGKGCTFKVLLPRNVSTKIVDGYLVSTASGTVYVLPLKSVIEAFAAHPDQIGSVRNAAQIVTRRGMIYPLIPLGERVGDTPAGGSSNGGDTLVLVRHGGRSAALSVAAVVGVQKIVVKPIEGMPMHADLFDGAALLGDGRVALVLGDRGLTHVCDHSERTNA
ncbi:chemotaxis protein CheA [Desulfatiferula olefinivorans]